ncbi:hypothetical protein MNBD_CHLOROFLEXI01-4328 [hydrothermal vent metagenome]|uniref:Uncharacterized protein n=1 Tax=hydrothermal vent metagenome TaxID=652676 RepID=A0A3B0W866_9ZZZZ
MWRRGITKEGVIVGSIAVSSLLFLAAVGFNLSSALRGPEAWRWAYAIPGRPFRHLLPLLIVTLYLLLIFRYQQLPKRRVWLRLLSLWIAVPIIQLALLWPESPDIVQPLFFRTISPGASGIFTVGSGIENVWSYLAQYPELMPTFPVHPQRYPPGLPLLFYGMRWPFEQWPDLSNSIGFGLRQYQCQDLGLMRLSNATLATAVLQMALPLLSGLVIFPLYGLARRTVGKKAAYWSVLLYPLVPSFALWAARWDQFYPLLTTLSWYLLCVGLMDRRRWAILLSGVVLSIATIFSFGMVVMLVPMGLWALIWWWVRGKRPFSYIFVDGLIFVLGLASLWLLYEFAFGIGLREIWRVSMSYHLGLARDYWTWLFYHLYDFGTFLSLPILILFVWAVAGACRNLPQKVYPMPIAFGLGLLLLDLSGTSQGEVARVWLFLTPFAVICAAWGIAQLNLSRRQLGILFGVTAVHLLTFNTFLRVVTTGVPDPIVRQSTYELPAVEYPIEANFDNRIRLLGYNLETEKLPTDNSIQVTLYWQARQPMAQSYTVFTHLLDAKGQLVTQQDNLPVQGTLPTTCWLPGEIIEDRYQLILDEADATLESYKLITGLYQIETGERLSIIGAATDKQEVVLFNYDD